MKLTIHLLGPHIKCTPFAYPVYRDIFARYFSFTDDITKADYVVMGLERNLHDHWKELRIGLAAKRTQKLFVVSEEPYWDLVLSRPGTDRQRQVTVEGYQFQYSVLCHSTTDIFQFECLPYFITTQNRFIARYRHMFARNIHYSVSQLLDHLFKAQHKLVMVAERRDGAKYAKSCLEAGLIGLMQFRTNLMAECAKKDAMVLGRGWHTDEMRQDLPDWHLDKLAMLDLQCTFISALENTHHNHYVSEKFFDSMACLSVPVYFAQPTHSIFKLADKSCFVQLTEPNVEDALQKIATFELNTEFASNYLDTQKFLYSLLSNNFVLIKQRAYFASRFMEAIIAS